MTNSFGQATGTPIALSTVVYSSSTGIGRQAPRTIGTDIETRTFSSPKGTVWIFSSRPAFGKTNPLATMLSFDSRASQQFAYN